MPLDKKGWTYTEPSPYNPPGNLQLGQAQVIFIDLASGELPEPQLRPVNGAVMVPLYTDFKLHDICSGVESPNREPLDQHTSVRSAAFFDGNARF